MGYPVYKLLRAVNRQYPNNNFINFVDVNEDMPNEHGEKYLIDEDLRDLINEALNETYIHIARDEVFTFPTVPRSKRICFTVGLRFARCARGGKKRGSTTSTFSMWRMSTTLQRHR